MLIPTTYKISNYTALGLNLKYLTQKAGAGSYHAKFGLDAGMRTNYQPFIFALTARNLIDPQMVSFLPQYAFGAAFVSDFLICECDLFASNWQEFSSAQRGLRFSGEILFHHYYAFRAGYQTYCLEEYISFGLGICDLFKTNGVDYCYIAPKNNFHAGTHWLSYTYLAP